MYELWFFQKQKALKSWITILHLAEVLTKTMISTMYMSTVSSFLNFFFNCTSVSLLFFAFCSEGTQDKPDQKVKDHSYVEATFEKYEVEEYEIDSTKAETISRIERMADMNRIKQVIEEMGIKIKHPTILHTDNIGSVINIENGNNWDMGENGSLKWLEDLKLQDIKKVLFKDQ